MDELSETVSLSESESLPVELPEPEMIASGVVKSVLGRGGASVVYEIWNPQLEVFRAVKLWRLAQSEKSLKRFEQEIKITAKLKHPNIVEIHSAGKWNGLPYMETEKIWGQDLKSLIDSKGAFPEIVVSAIALCICRALIYAHNHLYTLSEVTCRGVVHCDIKPANIMISKSGVVKLMDFGIALPTNNTNPAENSSVTGSLQYMAPEQLESKPVDPRSDLYSLGILLYEMYSGKKAFPADTREELIQKRKTDDFQPLDCLDINISQKARSVVERLMQTDPEDRFQSAFELMEELQKIYWKATDLQPQAVISGFLEGKKLELRKAKDLRKLLVPALSAACILFVAVYLIISMSNSKSSSKTKDVVSAPVASTVDSKPLQNQISRNRKPQKPLSKHVSKPDKSSSGLSAPQKRSAEAKGMSRSKVMRSEQKPLTQSSSKVSMSGPETTGSSPRKAKPQIKKEIKPVQHASKAENRDSAPADESKVKGQEGKKEITPTPESVLDEISTLIKEGELTSAERMVQENPLNDGEYHLLYSEILLKRNQLKTAKAEALKALRVPASRISSSEMRNRFLYLKACILAADYDRSPQEQSGQEAMEAWYEVKFAYRSDVSHPYYTRADLEIRRISASIQQ